MRERCDVLVAGTGIAGLTAAITCREAGLRVLVITKEDRIQETNTNYAQGGIIAAKEGSDPALLEKDILEAGCRLNNREAVSLFSREAPALVFDFLIDKVGTVFSKNDSGAYDYTEEAAHSERRILHFEDHTGDSIEESLIAHAKKIGVEIRSGYTAVDLITNNHHSEDSQELYQPREVFGMYALENATGEVHTLFADSVILATGGLGNIFHFTTNPLAATGDGIAMAWQAGADIINAEFVQFHPTALFHKDIKRFLISESLRGEGAKLMDRQGRPFMHKYDAREELAPRDVVTRAIYEEMSRQGSEYMLLDIAGHYLGEKPIQERFSRIWETCKKGGIDITKDPIPVVPAAHYFCGGIKVNTEGKSSIARLFAVGEVACTGIHGANRLASTSLLEGLFWGRKAGLSIAAGGNKIADRRLESIPDWRTPAQAERFESALIYQDWKMIKLTMWNHAGIVRTKRSLERAQADLDYHAHRITKFYREAILDRDIIELRNGVSAARIVTAAALHNTKSAGCHYRKD
ncbi:MAG: L-aspartate oxidase [Spirochaetales bacterium]|nr:L-aspartate oxidase [Spirochaetales bacterium]